MTICIICLLVFSSLSFAQSSVNDRRIEEDKRRDLRTTESNQPGERTEQPPNRPSPMRPLDRMYFAELIIKKITYHYDLCKVISLLLEKENIYITLAAQIRLLKENDFLPSKFKDEFPPSEEHAPDARLRARRA